ncbi:TRAP transporter substrate-binding protein [Fusobacterium sp. FSA-380-WT-3A]|uniref:TRAP transporter substrate-binding protein n=1 Tax=Fusobacterium sp. FSA-380-WT-3A TaxID=2725304 RepID=UPI00197F3EF7|nr:TRAP transporter substrate-binding protein [Fusobacterium sp. FSA-380-WT-3A]
MFEGMQLGTVDMAIMTNAYASNFVNASGVFDLPFIFKDSNTAAKILDSDLGTRVLNEYENKKVKALSWGEGGFRHLVTMNRGVKKPEDFRGLKIRCMETNTYIETYNALKTNAVPMAWSETITGLQQKTIDGLDIPISVIYSNGFPEIAKYLSLTGHFYSPLVMCMSLDVWNGLDDQQKQIISDSSKEAGKLCRQHNQEVEQVLLQKMKEQGMTIIRDVDIKSFQNILGDFYMKQSSYIGGTYVEDLLKELKNN